MKKQLIYLAILATTLFSQVGRTQNQPSLPADGPQYFSNTVTGFMWIYTTLEDKGCRYCYSYSPQYYCDETSVGQSMKYHQPRSKNNDYVYTCVRADNSTQARLPGDGPNYFSNKVESFKWQFAGINDHECKSCERYSPSRVCDSSSVGVMMRVRQPKTKDNDYMYVCRYSN